MRTNIYGGMLILLSAAFPAAADLEEEVERYLLAQAGAETEYRMRTETVVGSPEAARTRGGSAGYVGTEVLRDFSYADINRILRREPGVYVREEDGYGLFPNISLRGVDTTRSGKVTLMEDGVLSAPAPYSAPSAYYSPNAGRMHAVEVLKGTSQIQYGPHITGGVINYVSTPIPEEAEGYLHTLYGMEDEVRVHAWYGGTWDVGSGRVGFLLEGYYRTTTGYKKIDLAPDFRQSDADDTGFTRSEPMLKLSYEPHWSTYNRFELKLGYTDFEAHETYLGLSEGDFDDDPHRRYAASRFDHMNAHHTRIAFRHLVALSEEMELESVVYYNNFHRNWAKLDSLEDVEDSTNPMSSVEMSLSEALAGANGGFGLDVLRGMRAGTLVLRNGNRKYYLAGAQTAFRWRFESGETKHAFEAGLRYHVDRVRRFQRDERFFQADNGALVDYDPGAPGDAGNRRQETRALALHLLDEITIGRWTITPGIRVELLDQEHADFSSMVTGDTSMTLVGGGVSAVYRHTDEWSFLGGVHRGFSPPDPRSADLQGLDEETSLGFELGVRHQDAEGIWSAGAIGFLTHFDDLIVLDNIGGTGSGEPDNGGEVLAYGLELVFDYNLGRACDWGIENVWFLSFTYTRAVLDGDSQSTDPESIFAGGEDGNRVPYIPEFQLTFGTRVEIDRFGFGVQGSFVDSVYTSASNTSMQLDNAGNPDARFGKTDALFLVDVSAWYRIHERARVLAGVQNLFDEDGIVSRHPHGPRPSKPFFAYAGVELNF